MKSSEYEEVIRKRYVGVKLLFILPDRGLLEYKYDDEEMVNPLTLKTHHFPAFLRPIAADSEIILIEFIDTHWRKQNQGSMTLVIKNRRGFPGFIEIKEETVFCRICKKKGLYKEAMSVETAERKYHNSNYADYCEIHAQSIISEESKWL